MKNKIKLITLTIIIGLSAFFWGKTETETIEVHTMQNVAIYYASDNGYIIDEDGERFNVTFNCEDDTTIFVTYDNNNTVTRRDDKPISFEVLDK